ncbi:MAG TPA: hypothetical protein VFO07_08735 [Roseiflexaceae bacterium]|nr:hypothetical protein [Roseiflexaceae bacterium]
MSNDDLKRQLGAQAALAFLLLPGLCALPLLGLITPPPARYLFLGVWALLFLAFAAIVVRAITSMRRQDEEHDG